MWLFHLIVGKGGANEKRKPVSKQNRSSERKLERDIEKSLKKEQKMRKTRKGSFKALILSVVFLLPILLIWLLAFDCVLEMSLNKLKKDVDEVNRTGGNEGTEFDGYTKIFNSLPELTENHMNTIATVSLGKVKERSLDSCVKKDNDMVFRGGIDGNELLNSYVQKENDMMISCGVDRNELLGAFKRNSLDFCVKKDNDMMVKGGIDRNKLLGTLKGKDTKIDELHFAAMSVISAETTNPSEAEAMEAALRESVVDTSSFQYLKKTKALDVSSALSISASRNNSVDWAEKLYGQSISAATAGVKNRQLALSRTVEALMEGKPNPEIHSYLVFDPPAPKSSSGTGSNHLKGPFKEPIVFMIRGGNYVEYGSLQDLAHHWQPVKHEKGSMSWAMHFFLDFMLE
ncbi:hypothetical protein PTKIN_Ptkin10aG0172800 [Pterospermum kingtungense]